MKKASFKKLLSCVCEDLLVNEQMALLRSGSIISEICLHCTLRWLAGGSHLASGSHLDITDVAGISKPSFCRVVWKTVATTVRCKELDNVWPKTSDEIKSVVGGFSGISENGVMTNCAGVADGFLIRIKVPDQKEVGNVRGFFSGHCQCCGINIQALQL
jgi:hypothetical protein